MFSAFVKIVVFSHFTADTFRPGKETDPKFFQTCNQKTANWKLAEQKKQSKTADVNNQKTNAKINDKHFLTSAKCFFLSSRQSLEN